MKKITRLLKRAALLMALASTVHANPPITTVTIDTHVPGSTPTVTNLSDENFWGAKFSFNTYACTSESMTPTAVDCGTPTVKVPAISSGPFTVWVGPGTIDCYRYLRVNSNGSVVPDLSVGPNGYMKCPQ